ncbi:MAG: ADP-ribosylglycohydrolase family protein, partial [Anaerolineae bacterium]|nr:ADP-ribosylglycohydrolase family protein [Anaerolineae bacterium]
AESLLAHRPLDPADLAQRFVDWVRANPPDVGIHTRTVLSRIAAGQDWRQVMAVICAEKPDSAGNGSVMRCWPVAVACWDDLEQLVLDSRLQSQVTHPHVDCVAGSAFVNITCYHLFHGDSHSQAVQKALTTAELRKPLRLAIESASACQRTDLPNTGWVRHTLQSAVWGLLTTDSFEDAVVQVVNLGGDADTAGAVVGAMAGAAYGLSQIPKRWLSVLRGEFPLGSGIEWNVDRLVDVAKRLAKH